jgi:hypothetical protein
MDKFCTEMFIDYSVIEAPYTFLNIHTRMLCINERRHCKIWFMNPVT